MTAILTDLGPAATYTGGTGHDALRDIRALVEHAITNHPRSLQKRIGPSEIGTPCDHCLAAKLAAWEQVPDRTVPWLPTIGTAVHAWLEEQFLRHEVARINADQPTRRWVVEQTVTVGRIGGQDITGSCDLFDTHTGTVIDWKIVGASRLRKVKAGPPPVYRRQVHLYGRGWTNAGARVEHVAIAFLPRNAMSLDDAVWWTEPYDEQVAVAALDRADRIATNLTVLAGLGPDAVAAWIGQLERDPDCFDCPRYPDGAHLTRPGHRPGNDVAGLIP